MPAQSLTGLITLATEGYTITKECTDIVPYTGDENFRLIQKFLLVKKVAGRSKRTLQAYGEALNNQIPKLNKRVIEVTTDDIVAWLARLEFVEHVGPRGRDNYRRVLSSFFTWLHDEAIMVIEVTTDDIVAWLARLEFVEHVGPRGRDNYRRVLSSFFTWLHDEAIIPKNPMKAVPNIKIPATKKNALTDLEVEKLRQSCKSTREKFIFEALLSTGCRRDELIQIQRNEIDGNKVLVHGKGSKDRYVYLNAKAQLALEAYLAERKDSNPFLFPATIWTGKKISEIAKTNNHNKGGSYYSWQHPEDLLPNGHNYGDLISDEVKKVAKRAGVEHVHPHKFRRTFATNALKHGMPIEQVQQLLGHCDINTTQIYLDMDEADLKRAHEKYVV